MMAILGIGHYLCEACMHFNTDGNDGNHPYCRKQPYNVEWHRAIRLGDECPYGYKFGIPSGYPVSMKRNEERAYMVKAMMGKHARMMNNDGA